MSSLSKSGLPRWPFWAGGSDFRGRAGSAITHPATVAALGVLLVNDLLFKALWPHSWLTGKLSDLAWVVFALPLLAFLLSFAARRNVRARRVAFVAAYVGLPVLYAAFNTFEPVHDVIMRGISLAGGAAGSPRDATDSLVIPLAWGAALWVWSRRPAAADAMRLRWAVLVAGVAALASVATSESGPVYGVQRIGVSPDGLVVADVDYGGFWSLDGGLTWNTIEHQLGDIAWGDQDVETPRGRYILDGPRVLRVSADGAKEEVVYSAEYLKQDGNVWVQTVSTESLGRRSIGTQPVAMVYDDRTGNLLLAMGIQGVVVGTADGQWITIAVGWFEPSDFTFAGKTRMLFTDVRFWTAILLISACMAGFGLIVSEFRLQDLIRAIPLVLVTGVVVLAATAMSLVGLFIFSEIMPLTPIVTALLGTMVVAMSIGLMPRQSTTRCLVTVAIGCLALLGSGTLIVLFGSSDGEPISYDREFRHNAIAVATSVAAVASLLVSWPRLLKNWGSVAVSLAVMTVVAAVVFMIWLLLGITSALAKTSVIALCGGAMILLAGHARRKLPAETTLCPTCGRGTSAFDRRCPGCGAVLGVNTEIRGTNSDLHSPEHRRLVETVSRALSGSLDLLLVLVITEIGILVYESTGLPGGKSLNVQHLIVLLSTFTLAYGVILVSASGTTAGKRAMNWRVVRTDGSRVSFRRAFLRELVKFGPMLVVNAVVMAFRADRRGLHDLLADTVVVRREKN